MLNETWSLNTLRDSIDATYDRSLPQEKIWIYTTTLDIEGLLFPIPLNRKYRPTLFDILAHSALEYYSYSSNFASVNAEDEFAFSAPELYEDTPQFTAINFPENTQYTSGVKVLQNWQEI